jgi:hypothetical protein
MPRSFILRIRSRISRKPWILDQRLPKTDALKHSFGIAAKPSVPGVAEANKFQEFFNPVAEVAPLQTTDLPVELQSFRPGEKFMEAGAFRKKSDVLAAFHPRTVTPENLCRTRRRGNQTKHDLHGRAFPGTVGTEKSVDLPGFYLEAQISDCDDALTFERNPEDLGEIPDTNGRRHR